MRSQGAVGYLNAVKLQLILIVGTGQAVGTHQWFALVFQRYHGEMAILEAKALIPCGFKAEQAFGLVMYDGDLFSKYACHVLRIPFL